MTARPSQPTGFALHGYLYEYHGVVNRGVHIAGARLGLLIATSLTAILCEVWVATLGMAAPSPTALASGGASSSLPPLRLCAPTDRPSADISARPGYMQFQVSVSDASGKPIIHLKESDFVFANELHPPQVVYFREDSSGPPASFIVLVDSSGSMKPKLPKVQNSLAAFLDTLNPCDEVETVAFSSKNGVKILQPFTTDRAIAAESVGTIVPYGQTPLYDAIHQGLQALAFADYPSRSLIIITDGMDNSSTTSKPDLIAEVQKDGVPIYAIGIGDQKASALPGIAIGPFVFGGDIDRVDADTLNAIADTPRGRSFIVPPISKDSGAGLISALASISDIVGNGYAIGAIMPSVAAAPTITIANRPSATVHVSITPPSNTAHTP